MRDLHGQVGMVPMDGGEDVQAMVASFVGRITTPACVIVISLGDDADAHERELASMPNNPGHSMGVLKLVRDVEPLELFSDIQATLATMPGDMTKVVFLDKVAFSHVFGSGRGGPHLSQIATLASGFYTIMFVPRAIAHFNTMTANENTVLH